MVNDSTFRLGGAWLEAKGETVVEYDNLWDGTVDTSFWTESTSGDGGTATEENGGIRVSSAGIGAPSSGSITLISDVDLRNFGRPYCSFSVGGHAQASASRSASIYVRLTDGAGNNQNLIAITGSTAYRAVSAFVTLRLEGNNVNVKLIVMNDTGSTTVIADDTDVDITTWGGLYIESSASESHSAGFPGGTSERASVSNILFSNSALPSKGTER